MINRETPDARRSVRIERNDNSLSWNAICPDCNSCVFMLTDEAVAHGPRRPTGSTALLPVTMSVGHECMAPNTPYGTVDNTAQHL